MIIIVYLIFTSIIFDTHQAINQNYSLIDEYWIDYIIAAPTTINLLGQTMATLSGMNISLERYLSNYNYEYIKYSESINIILLQISNEVYHNFLDAHSSMNRIQTQMKQIEEHLETAKKILSTNVSLKLTNQRFSRSMKNIEHIGNACVSLAKGAEDSFLSVLNLISEVKEVIKVTQNGYEEDVRKGRIELNNFVIRYDYTQIIKMLKQAFELLGEATRNFINLHSFFLGLRAMIVLGFSDGLNTFIGTTNVLLDPEALEIDRKVMMGLLSEAGGNLYRESYLIRIVSRLYYDISNKYRIPRLQILSSILSINNSSQRQQKFLELKRNITKVQAEVKILLKEPKQVISKRRAQITEAINRLSLNAS